MTTVIRMMGSLSALDLRRCDGAQFFGGMNLVKAGKIHKLAASLYKPRGSKRGNKVVAYSPEITVSQNCN